MEKQINSAEITHVFITPDRKVAKKVMAAVEKKVTHYSMLNGAIHTHFANLERALERTAWSLKVLADAGYKTKAYYITDEDFGNGGISYNGLLPNPKVPALTSFVLVEGTCVRRFPISITHITANEQ